MRNKERALHLVGVGCYCKSHNFQLRYKTNKYGINCASHDRILYVYGTLHGLLFKTLSAHIETS